MSVTTPRLTLGLPVYNGERFLAQSLDALLAQTYSDFELIISDNGSSDRTSEIAKQYQSVDPRIRYVRHDQNRGSTFNHNFAMGQARGELFKWVSDDDLYAQSCSSGVSRPSTLVPSWPSRIPGQHSSTKRARSLSGHTMG